MLPPRLHKNSGKADEKRRSPAHRAWVRGHHCVVPGCDRMPIECAHIRLGTDGGTGIKPSDKWCVSMCGNIDGHHAESHRLGEDSFARKYGINLKALAAEFFARSPHRGKLS